MKAKTKTGKSKQREHDELFTLHVVLRLCEATKHVKSWRIKYAFLQAVRTLHAVTQEKPAAKPRALKLVRRK